MSPMLPDSAPEPPATPAQRATDVALCSAFIPGLGQALQGRFVAAAVQFGTVAAYLLGALTLGGSHAWIAALAWNLWSVIDAYRYEAE